MISTTPSEVRLKFAVHHFLVDERMIEHTIDSTWFGYYATDDVWKRWNDHILSRDSILVN